ncbi:hypothetical protein [Knoellia koreensis]|uniref:Uncharacterized protein n=1 Tax=Knoellia koreensis TaxID=2730921 RepID=A0A849HKW0_9MICO|nr:hypothetical protein [Knoellia sp. DB2414S]NNM47184.1 hypothetical protein [Knoellia sp. DB2414S]
MDERNAGTDETLARITELARRALQSQTDLAKQSFELGRATLSGDVDRTTTSRAYLDAAAREGARYWQEVGALGIDYATELMALGTRSAARVLSETRTAGRSRPARGSTAHGSGPTTHGTSSAPPDVEVEEPSRRSAVVVRGVLGQTAQATVTVVNRHPRARRVELTPSELHDANGLVVDATLRVDPRRVTIPPGEEFQVRLEVDLDPAQAAVGDRYEGTLQVTGGDEALLDVTVEVVA